MGRLFWKFFFFIWLAQLTAIAGISVTLWLKHRNEEVSTVTNADYGKPEHGEARLSGQPPELRKEAVPAHGGPPDGPREFYEHHESPHHMPGREGGDSRALIPMAVALLASLMFAALMAWYMSKPIRRLSDAFQALAGGRMHTRIGDSMGRRQDELAALGHDFDRMAEQLTGALQNQRRLLHDVSHELRSPLARLQAAIGLARQQPDKAEAYMVRMEREAVRMDKLVGEILTLSRLEAGATVGQDLIHLDELFTELSDNAHFEAEAAGKYFQVNYVGVELSNLCMHGRYELLHRAIENVLRNAIRHTVVASTVTLQVEVRGAQLHVTVLDEGDGVPDAELQNIFYPFYRSLHAEQSTEGYGLGLAITQRVMQAHGGRIDASNRATGGLCMHLVLPVAFA